MFVITGIRPGFSQQVAKGLNSSTGDYLGFLEYKPADYNNTTTTKYPLIIFLHGIGERGNGTTMLQDVTCCGIPRIIRLGHKMKFTWNGKTETFLVISPQCPEKYGMWPAVFITELINYAKANLRIDPNRIFLTGLSMGGGGTFRFISTGADQPKQLAGAATICAPCTFSQPLDVVNAHLPLWSFHAADDPTASVTCTQNAIARINEFNPNPKPLMTIWPTGGHIVWDRVYTDTAYKYDGVVNIYEWFLGQNKSLPVNVLPVARAGNTINITTGTGSAKLDASASTDADGKLVRYVWRKVSGPTAGVITTPFGPTSSTTVTGLTTAGTYKYQLNVVDDRAAVSRDTLSIVVTSGTSVVNIPPVARAGTDANLILPANTYTLNGSGSTDEDGTIASYLWTKVSGPAATFVNTAAATTSVNGLIQGTYVFKLKVTDNKGASAEDQVTIVVNAVPNVAPVAKAGANITITLPTNTVTLNGSGSTDSDGTIATYLWTKVSGPAATIANTAGSSTAINDLVAGTYVFKLKITDNDGASAEDQVTVIVNAAPNVAPVAKAGANITITLPTNTVTLNGSGSTDSDGTIATYLWTKVSGPAATIANTAGSSTAINDLVAGTYVFKLKITDNDGASAEDQVTVTVNAALNMLPVARAGSDITITLPDNRTSVSGITSSDADGSIVSYAWAKLSGPSQFIIADAKASLTSITNLAEGTYTFRLLVTDNDGATDADTIVIKVNPAPPQPNIAPVAQAGQNQTITLPLDNVLLNGSGSSDQDGNITSFDWSYLTGPSTYTLNNAVSPTANVTGMAAGVYTFRLQVKDNDGDVDADTISITVEEAAAPPPPPNVAPDAIAGNDIDITLPVNQVTLNGSSSSDADGNITNYSWKKIGGPASFNIVSSFATSTIIENLIEGTYEFELQVKDNNGALSKDTVNIIVHAAPNETPASDAGPDMQVQLPDPNIQLNGSNSYDPDGTVTDYSWEQVSGPNTSTITNATGAATSITGIIEGVYIFRLTVTDNNGTKASDVMKVTVLAADIPNVGPVADAGSDFEVTLPDPNIQLNGTGSSDADGNIVAYSWTRVNGPGGVTITNSDGATPGIIGVAEGVYTFRLTVTDNDGEEASDEVKLTVHPEVIVNATPQADAGDDRTISYPDASINISGADSKDDDGTISDYEWTMLDGPAPAAIVNANSPSTMINDLQTGEYKFVLTVVDNKGAVARDTVSISVINTQRFTEEFKVFPNPARSELNVQLISDTLGTTRITIYNTSGMIMQSVNVEKAQPQLFKNMNVASFQSGLYYLEVIVDGKVRKITKFIKRQ
ncbi:MAG TPA: PKD domain-containing protein [Flavitalea sp.]|nr:PKD domain-containing protein [Flavitalea sp.]